MSITLPVRSVGGDRREQGIRVPGPQNVPHLREAPDPGVDVPKGAFDTGGGALQAAGKTLGSAADRLQAANDRADRLRAADEQQKARQDVIASTSGEATFSTKAQDLLAKIQEEGKLADPQTSSRFGAELATVRQEALDGFTGSEAGRTDFAGRLQAAHGDIARRAGMMFAEAGQRQVETAVSGDINGFVGQARQNPVSLPELFTDFDRQLDRYGPVLSPEGRLSLQATGRGQMVLGAVDAYLIRGDADGARAVLASTPSALRALSPEAQARLARSFRQVDEQRSERLGAAREKVDLFQGLYGRSPTVAERLNLADISADNLQDRVGKALADIGAYARQYGAHSPQAAALKASFTGGIDGGKLPPQAHYAAESRDFVTARDAFEGIGAAMDNRTARGDLDLIRNFVKLSDPAGAVVERDFPQTAASGGYGPQVQAWAQQLAAGNRLTPAMRNELTGEATRIMTAGVKAQAGREARYKTQARSAGAAPAAGLDFIGDYRMLLDLPDPPPTVGAVLDGHRFKGGDPSLPASWERVR